MAAGSEVTSTVCSSKMGFTSTLGEVTSEVMGISTVLAASGAAGRDTTTCSLATGGAEVRLTVTAGSGALMVLTMLLGVRVTPPAVRVTPPGAMRVGVVVVKIRLMELGREMLLMELGVRVTPFVVRGLPPEVDRKVVVGVLLENAK